ncbi:MAG: integration host factor subunit beta [Fibrobacter sp.]|nr:integration host factor subunit beta [Fibrobacter sp.]
MTKQDLIQEVARSTGFIQLDIKSTVEELLKQIGKSLDLNSNIEIRGFGTFSLRVRKSRPARNLRTGEEVILPERLVPVFKYSATLRKRISSSISHGVKLPSTTIDKNIS